MRRLLSRGLTVATAFALVGCGGGDGPTGGAGDGNGGGAPAATSISVVSGDNQRGVQGSGLLAGFVVKVGDAQGNGVSGVTVGWSVTAGDGSLSQTSTPTNSTGQATVVLTLGSTATQNTVTASAEGLTGSPLTFTATGVVPAAIAATAGDLQTAGHNLQLAQPLVVTVTASDAGPVPGLQVMWVVTGGGGTLSAASTTTDAAGQTSVDLTLGSMLGANNVTASAAGLAGTAMFQATGTNLTITIDMIGTAFVVPLAFRTPGGDADDATILFGDGIKWINRDFVQHTATSGTGGTPGGGVPAGGTAFDSPFLNSGGSFTFVPSTVGEWLYFCQVHPVEMRDATITVN